VYRPEIGPYHSMEAFHDIDQATHQSGPAVYLLLRDKLKLNIGRSTRGEVV
jgi:hypothetical protein